MSLQYRMSQCCIRLVARGIFRWRVIGRENIPSSGALIASNHLSVFDPPLLGAAIKRDMYYFAKIELFKNKLFGALLKSVNAFPVRRGETDLTAWKTARRLLSSGKLLLFFPEGTRSKDGNLQEAKPGLAKLAFFANVPVVPAVISGSNRLKDVFWGRSKLRVGFAEPLALAQFESAPNGEERYSRLTAAVMSEIAKLKAKVEES